MRINNENFICGRRDALDRRLRPREDEKKLRRKEGDERDRGVGRNESGRVGEAGIVGDLEVDDVRDGRREEAPLADEFPVAVQGSVSPECGRGETHSSCQAAAEPSTEPATTSWRPPSSRILSTVMAPASRIVAEGGGFSRSAYLTTQIAPEPRRRFSSAVEPARREEDALYPSKTRKRSRLTTQVTLVLHVAGPLDLYSDWHCIGSATFPPERSIAGTESVEMLSRTREPSGSERTTRNVAGRVEEGVRGRRWTWSVAASRLVPVRMKLAGGGQQVTAGGDRESSLEDTALVVSCRIQSVRAKLEASCYEDVAVAFDANVHDTTSDRQIPQRRNPLIANRKQLLNQRQQIVQKLQIK
mgnify:CR=1 FL=1